MSDKNTSKSVSTEDGDAFVRVTSVFFTSIGVGLVCVVIGIFLTWR